MKTLIDLMRIDVIALKGKKGGDFMAMAILFVVWGLIGILFLPVFWALYAFVVAVLTVPMIVHQEVRREYEKTFCIVPADRKSIVFARFLLVVLIASGAGIILYILMQISLAMGFSNQTTGEIGEIFELLDISTSILEFHNVVFSAAFMIGLMIMAKMLRNYFKNGAVSKKNSLLRNVLKGILIYIIFIVVVSILMYASTIPFVQTAFSLIFAIFSALSRPADGILLCLTFLAAGYGMTVYQAVCAVLEYDEREL